MTCHFMGPKCIFSKILTFAPNALKKVDNKIVLQVLYLVAKSLIKIELVAIIENRTCMAWERGNLG